MATVALNSPAGKWVMVPTILASSMAFIDATALNVVLPSLQKSLHATAADLFWILNAYLLMLAALILTGGAMGDRLGRKRVYMIGIFIFIVASAACGLVGDVRVFIACRIVQGIGGALMIPGSLSLISSSIDEKERGKAIGTWSAFTTVVTMGGPILGGALADAGLWRYIFFINAPIGIVSLLILRGKVQETREMSSSGALDIPGAVAIALGLALVTFGCLRIPALGLGHGQVLGTLGAGVALLLAFVMIEQKSAAPMMPMSLFRNRNFSGANLLTFFLYAGLGAGMLFLGLNLVQVQGYSQTQSGMSFLPFTILMILIARRAGALADRYGPRLLLVGGPALAGMGLFWLSCIGLTHGPTDYWKSYFPGIVLFGLGMSFTVAPLTATVMSSVSAHFSGTASGINNALTRVANVFANAILGAIAVLVFSISVERGVSGLGLGGSERTSVLAQAAELGNAKAPKGLAGSSKEKIERIYKLAFVDAYQLMMRISAGLAWLGALMALWWVRKPAIRER